MVRRVTAPYIPLHDGEAQIPTPSHRHAAPSAPWPWVDLSDEVDQEQLNADGDTVPDPCDHQICSGECWTKYPQSRFPNWTPRQVKKSKILKAVQEYDPSRPCKLHYVDVDNKGRFTSARETVVTKQNLSDSWKLFVEDMERPPNLRVRAIFIEDLSGPVLQMLGAKFNIEPFFWSSSLNWIPSRYQEDKQTRIGDHITICLTFLRSMPDPNIRKKSSESTNSARSSIMSQRRIDTRAPLPLPSTGHRLVLDLLSVHLIRNSNGSTIISYHPSYPLEATTAKTLHDRIQFAGQSVYWQKMFQKTSDPTFVLLTFLWHAVYAWDEALEKLYSHICDLETKAIETNEMSLTTQLHEIRAHQLHYSTLLDSFQKSVQFIQDTPNPALDSMDREEKEQTELLIKRECNMMLDEIRRLDMSRRMHDKRLKNVMNLVFSRVNINDSGKMQEMTEAAMKQVAYLTMIFLPSSFVAAVFGMNVREISPTAKGTLPHYFGAALSMTIATIWIIVAFQSQYALLKGYPLKMRIFWPFVLLAEWMGWKYGNKYKTEEKVMEKER